MEISLDTRYITQLNIDQYTTDMHLIGKSLDKDIHQLRLMSRSKLCMETMSDSTEEKDQTNFYSSVFKRILKSIINFIELAYLKISQFIKDVFVYDFSVYKSLGIMVNKTAQQIIRLKADDKNQLARLMSSSQLTGILKYDTTKELFMVIGAVLHYLIHKVTPEIKRQIGLFNNPSSLKDLEMKWADEQLLGLLKKIGITLGNESDNYGFIKVPIFKSSEVTTMYDADFKTTNNVLEMYNVFQSKIWNEHTNMGRITKTFESAKLEMTQKLRNIDSDNNRGEYETAIKVLKTNIDLFLQLVSMVTSVVRATMKYIETLINKLNKFIDTVTPIKS